MFDLPSNPKRPSEWQACGYGLCATNPFAESGFLSGKPREGSLEILGSGRLRFHDRVVIHPVGACSADIEALYVEYANRECA